MKTILQKAGERGHADHGWLKTNYSFSFSNYYDPAKVHFGLLRVLNDDIIAGGMGFGMHPHDNMEIVTIVLEGAVRHQDSMGNTEVIRSGEVQIMSAGTGITHSEVNDSEDVPLKLLQIWVFPKEKNITPRYEQKILDLKKHVNSMEAVVAPDKENGALWINQDAWFLLGSYKEEMSFSYSPRKKGNGLYIFVIEGSAEVAGERLGKRDSLSVEDYENLNIKAVPGAELLFIDVPMR